MSLYYINFLLQPSDTVAYHFITDEERTILWYVKASMYCPRQFSSKAVEV